MGHLGDRLGWVHLCKSNAEPIVRIYAEAHNAEKATALATAVADFAKTMM